MTVDRMCKYPFSELCPEISEKCTLPVVVGQNFAKKPKKSTRNSSDTPLLVCDGAGLLLLSWCTIGDEGVWKKSKQGRYFEGNDFGLCNTIVNTSNNKANNGYSIYYDDGVQRAQINNTIEHPKCIGLHSCSSKKSAQELREIILQ